MSSQKYLLSLHFFFLLSSASNLAKSLFSWRKKNVYFFFSNSPQRKWKNVDMKPLKIIYSLFYFFFLYFCLSVRQICLSYFIYLKVGFTDFFTFCFSIPAYFSFFFPFLASVCRFLVQRRLMSRINTKLIKDKFFIS